MKNLHIIATDKPSRLVKFFTKKFHLCKEILPIEDEEQYQNIYVTNSEEIKDGDWVITPNPQKPLEKVTKETYLPHYNKKRKIILTTDQDLIADGVQSIDDEFLEWFVNNPSCEEVEVESQMVIDYSFPRSIFYRYKIVIPKVEPNRSCTQDVIDAAQKEVSNNVRLPKVVREGIIKPEQEFYGYDPNAPGDPDKIDDLIEQKTLEEAVQKYLNNGKPQNVYSSFIEGANYQAERMYSEEDVINALHSVELKDNKDYSKIYTGMKEWFEQFKKK